MYAVEAKRCFIECEKYNYHILKQHILFQFQQRVNSAPSINCHAEILLTADCNNWHCHQIFTRSTLLFSFHLTNGNCEHHTDMKIAKFYGNVGYTYLHM